MYINVHMDIDISTSIYIYVCIYIYIDIDIDTQKDGRRIDGRSCPIGFEIDTISWRNSWARWACTCPSQRTGRVLRCSVAVWKTTSFFVFTS
jgi:hypothetical protein